MGLIDVNDRKLTAMHMVLRRASPEGESLARVLAQAMTRESETDQVQQQNQLTGSLQKPGRRSDQAVAARSTAAEPAKFLLLTRHYLEGRICESGEIVELAGLPSAQMCAINPAAEERRAAWLASLPGQPSAYG